MLFLALRHLLSRKRQTALTLIGIVLGTAAFITISGMMLGFQTFIVDQLVNNDAHIRISAREEFLSAASLSGAMFDSNQIVDWVKPPSGRKDNAYILSPRNWIDRLERDSEVAAVSPQLVVQAIATYGKVSVGVRVIGSEPERQTRVSTVAKYMLSGKFADIGNSGNRIAIGEALAQKIGVSMNETVYLASGRGMPQPFRVIGIFRLGVKALDESTIFAAIRDVQQLNFTPSRISDIAVRLTDVEKAAATATTWNLLSQEKVQSWDQSNEGIMSVFKTQDIVRNSMTISILVVAGFGIYNILSLAVNHKRREIAILRSMGFEPWDVSKLFLIQGLILGLIGGLVGIAGGLTACYFMSQIEVSANRGLGGNRLMVSFDLMIYVKAFVLAMLSSSFASYFPARSAGRLEPIDIIRSENA
jgi:lipoprotein-releasing system permease protein